LIFEFTFVAHGHTHGGAGHGHSHSHSHKDEPSKLHSGANLSLSCNLKLLWWLHWNTVARLEAICMTLYFSLKWK